MTALSDHDRSGLLELERLLFDIRRPTTDAEIMQELKELYGSPIVGRWKFVAETNGHTGIADIAVADNAVPSGYIRSFDAGLRDGSLDLLFSPRVPEVAQRNRSLEIPGVRKAMQMSMRAARGIGVSQTTHQERQRGLENVRVLLDRYNLADDYQLRTLICDGPLLLTYFVAMQPKPFSRRQRSIDRIVTASLQRRMLLDHRLNRAELGAAALDVALEHIGRATFIVDRRGVIVHANRMGEAALEADHDLATQLAVAITVGSAKFEVSPIIERGTPPQFLVVLRTHELSNVVGAIATELGLSPHAREVLEHLATGESTKAIAIRLGRSENTIEYHATRLYRQLGVHGRSELQRLLLERFAR